MIGIIDIGNTFIHCCKAIDTKIIQRKDFKESSKITDFFSDTQDILIISNDEEKRDEIKKILDDKNIYNFPVSKIKSDYNGRVGEDRVATAFYIKEKKLFPAIVIDAGTAITIDFINSKGIFSGGAILPGLGLFYNSFKEIKTLRFMNKDITIKSNKGKSTIDCISFGVFIYVNGIKEYVKNVKRQDIKNIFLTGNDAFFFKEKGWKIDKDLVLKGGLYAFHKFFPKRD